MIVHRVLVVDDTKLITRMIRDKLTASGYGVEEAYSGPEAFAKLRTFNPDLIILDVMLPGMDGYEIARRIRQDPSTRLVPILMLTAKAGIAEKIAGYEAGADDYLTKPFDPTELELHVRALIARAHAQRPTEEPSAPGGRIISLFSLRGGSGTSSLAVNLAAALALLYETDIPLVDLALESGSASLMLDLLPRLTLANLAREEGTTPSGSAGEAERSNRPLGTFGQPPPKPALYQKIDEDLLKGYMQRHSSGVRVLAAPASPVLAELVTPRLVQTVLPLLRKAYSNVVIDTAHQLNELNLAAFDLSDLIIVVLTPDMLSLKSTATVLETFHSLSYPPDRVMLVINWTFPRRGLPQKEIEAALGRSISLVLPHDSDSLVRAINEGVPAVIGQPASPWSSEVERLAYMVTAPGQRAQAEGAPSKRYAALKKRLPPTSS